MKNDFTSFDFRMPHPTARHTTHQPPPKAPAGNIACSYPAESDPDEWDGSARPAVTRPRITGPSWAGGAATAASRKELLPWFVGTAIPTAFVTGSTRTGGPTATASREHLLSRCRTAEQSKDCQSARQTSSNDALHRCSGKGGRSKAGRREPTIRLHPQA